jgi:hypothetical protein
MNNTKAKIKNEIDLESLNEIILMRELKKKNYYHKKKSKLDPFTVDILKLKDEHNFSFREISLWLSRNKFLKVSHVSIRNKYQQLKAVQKSLPPEFENKKSEPELEVANKKIYLKPKKLIKKKRISKLIDHKELIFQLLKLGVQQKNIIILLELESNTKVSRSRLSEFIYENYKGY